MPYTPKNSLLTRLFTLGLTINITKVFNIIETLFNGFKKFMFAFDAISIFLSVLINS